MLRYNDIYMDNNSTTAPIPAVLEAMDELRGLPLNASSVHALGRRARGLIETARKRIESFVNAGDARVIFTASGTESNNMALRCLDKYKVITSNIEHASIHKVGVHIHEVPVNGSGIFDVAGLEKLLRQYKGEKILVSVMLANNETGVVQPIEEIVDIVHAHGGLVHSDAVQCAGKINIDMQMLGVDMLSISAHKFGGPQGAGALIINKRIPINSLIYGGAQEYGYRAGTENVLAIHGFGVAAIEAPKAIKEMNNIKVLRDRMEQEIQSLAPDVALFSNNARRLPNTSMIAMPGVTSETQLMHFDMSGIAVSSGAACSSGKVETSHVLLAMGVAPDLAKCAIRVSLGINNTDKDTKKFISAWHSLYMRAGKKIAA